MQHAYQYGIDLKKIIEHFPTQRGDERRQWLSLWRHPGVDAHLQGASSTPLSPFWRVPAASTHWASEQCSRSRVVKHVFIRPQLSSITLRLVCCCCCWHSSCEDVLAVAFPLRSPIRGQLTGDQRRICKHVISSQDIAVWAIKCSYTTVNAIRPGQDVTKTWPLQ